jgi:hypothetical protein
VASDKNGVAGASENILHFTSKYDYLLAFLRLEMYIPFIECRDD